MDLALLKTFHISSMVFWMAGLLYLPRLFAYHSQVAPGSEMDQTFQVMEWRLLKIIMMPAIFLTWISGGFLIFSLGFENLIAQGWFHAKFFLICVLTGKHMFLARCQRNFGKGCNPYGNRFYRILNEVPAVFLILIVFLVVKKPF